MAKQKFKILPQINSPKDLKKLEKSHLGMLAREIRALITQTVSKNGGHLASNLGVVDLTIALHCAYNSPEDKLVWDVGHQAYTHKLLTGRHKNFSSLRKLKGLSGYLKLTENEHDVFGAGHVGTAVSSALGFAEARDLKNKKNHVVAIVGDGSLTNGLTYEGLNNIGNKGTDITVVLNDNKYSISKNIGGIAKYLEKLSAVQMTEDPKTDFEQVFHALGFTYFGPIDGHNIEKMLDVFKLAKETVGPKLVHILTKKGNGYLYSENKPDAFHFTSPFILESGKVAKDTKNLTYSKAFSKSLIRLAKKDRKIIGITAAMPAGTGLDKFGEVYPERFYDTGIAEEHAVTFAAGLALEKFKPVVAIYSTFLQRSYDEIIHDVALQKIPVIFAIDRAGIVGTDGPTHHGLFDLSYLRNIPNLVLMAPKDENELGHMLYTAMRYGRGPIAIRYPRGNGVGVKLDRKYKRLKIGKSEKLHKGEDIAILALGSMVYPALEAAKNLEVKGIKATVYNARFAKPIDENMVKESAKIGNILTIEENILEGGFGSAVLEALEKNNICNVAVKRIGVKGFIEHGEPEELRKLNGLTSENIEKEVIKFLAKRKNER